MAWIYLINNHGLVRTFDITLLSESPNFWVISGAWHEHCFQHFFRHSFSTFFWKDLSINWIRLEHELSVTWAWLDHGLSIKWVLLWHFFRHNLSMTCTWLEQYLSMTWAVLEHDFQLDSNMICGPVWPLLVVQEDVQKKLPANTIHWCLV